MVTISAWQFVSSIQFMNAIFKKHNIVIIIVCNNNFYVFTGHIIFP